MANDKEMKDGLINPGEAPESWKYTYERFSGYLWKEGNEIYISAIISWHAGKGHFRSLVAAIEADGFTVAVPCPLDGMEVILKKWGFAPKEEPHLDGSVDVWRRT